MKIRPAWKRLGYRLGRAPVYLPGPATAWAEEILADTIPEQVPDDHVRGGFPYAGSLSHSDWPGSGGGD